MPVGALAGLRPLEQGQAPPALHFAQIKLGCWAPHVEITRPAFEATLDVFQHARLITRRHRYEDLVAPPPEAG